MRSEHPAYIKPLEGIAAGIEASARSAEARWTKAHQALVDKAIEDVAGVKVFFTVDDVYQLLGDHFPKSKVWPRGSLSPSAPVS